DRFIKNRAAGHFLNILTEISDRELLRHRHGAVVGRLFTSDHAEKRRLAGAIWTDQSDLFTRVELERRVDKKNLTAILFADVGQRNHESSSNVLWEMKFLGVPFRGSTNASRLARSCIGGSTSRFSVIAG